MVGWRLQPVVGRTRRGRRGSSRRLGRCLLARPQAPSRPEGRRPFDAAAAALEQFVGLDADQTEQQNTIAAILAEDPTIDGVLGTGPVVAVTALRAAEAAGKDLAIGGFDITPEIIESIEAGDIDFTVDQQQYLQGYLPVILLFLQATNQNTAGGGLPILTGPGFVTPDNAAAVKELVAAGTR